MAVPADKIAITICGDGGCGKSSITLRLVRSEWTSEYDPTIEDSYSITRTVDGRDYTLSLTDTAGQEEYRSLWASSNLKSDAFLLVYDITNTSSLSTLEYFLDMIDAEAEQRLEENLHALKTGGKRGGGAAPPVKILAGNKCDLKEGRVISSREGLEWARKRGCGFMETSAREMVNIEETFALIIRRVVQARQLQSQDPSAADSSAARAVEASRRRYVNGEGGNNSVSMTAPLTEGEKRDLREKEEGLEGAGQKKKWWKRLGCW